MFDWVLGSFYAGLIVFRSIRDWQSMGHQGSLGHAAYGSGWPEGPVWLGPCHRAWLNVRRIVGPLSQYGRAFVCYVLFVILVAGLIREHVSHSAVLSGAGSGLSGFLVVLAACMPVIAVAKALAASPHNYLPACLLFDGKPTSLGSVGQSESQVGSVGTASSTFRARLSWVDGATGLVWTMLVLSILLILHWMGYRFFAWWALGISSLGLLLSVSSTVTEATVDEQVVKGRTLMGIRRFEYPLGELRISYQWRRWPSGSVLIVTRLGGWPLFIDSRGEGYSQLEQRILERVTRDAARRT